MTSAGVIFNLGVRIAAEHHGLTAEGPTILAWSSSMTLTDDFNDPGEGSYRSG